MPAQTERPDQTRDEWLEHYNNGTMYEPEDDWEEDIVPMKRERWNQLIYNTRTVRKTP